MQRTPEEQLLLAVLKLDTSKTELEHIESLARQVKDWESFSTLAIKRAIGPFLFKKLAQLPERGFIPNNIFMRLQQTYYKILSRSALQYEHLNRIVNAFSDRDIPIIVMKGIYLSEWLYKDIGLRQLSDIDVLIKEEDAGNCVEILKGMGYQSHESESISGFIEENVEPLHLPSMSFQGVNVEIHTRIFRQSEVKAIEPKLLWENAHAVIINGVQVFAFSLTDLLLHLCLHLDKHFQVRQVQFGWYADITNLMCRHAEEINWNELEERCRTSECTDRFFRHIMICHKWIGAPIPEKIKDKYIHLVNTSLETIFFKLLNGETEGYNISFLLLTNMKQLKGFQAKTKYLFHLAFPSKEYMVKHYHINHDSLFFLYYPHRLFIGISSAWKYLRNK